MYIVKRGWKEVTDGIVHDLFMEVLDEAMNLNLIRPTTTDFPRLFVHKSTNSLGTCYNHKNPDGSYSTSILVSEYLLACSPEVVRKTIIHEIGHMLCPEEGHGYFWHVRTNKLGAKWGYIATRLNENEEAHQAMASAREAKGGYKYELWCPHCNVSCGKYKSMCNAVKYPNLYRHKSCKTPLVARAI